jgi:hypothetical protein
MNDNIKRAAEKVSVVWEATDVALNEWISSKPEGNLQFPALLGMVAVKMNWDEKQVRENDPIVRYYVRNNSDWHVTRGAHGGIMPAAAKQKKEADRLARETAKENARTAVETKSDVE